MSQRHWHVPIPSRPVCPVCKKAVYSRSGIHPQCAVSQAEQVRPGKPGSAEAVGSAPAK